MFSERKKGASKAERGQVTVATEVSAAALGWEFQLGQEPSGGAGGGAFTWEDLLKDCPGNVGQCQQLPALTDSRVGSVPSHSSPTLRQDQRVAWSRPCGAGVNEPQSLDPDSRSGAQCTPSFPFKSWEPKREVWKLLLSVFA